MYKVRFSLETARPMLNPRHPGDVYVEGKHGVFSMGRLLV
jgi:hypothetical protein